jgi:hypothetical protein
MRLVMSMIATNDEEDLEVFPAELRLDGATLRWLARLERLTGAHPNQIIASMLRDIRRDDEAANASDRKKH